MTTALGTHRPPHEEDIAFDERDPLSWILGFDATGFLNEVLNEQAFHCQNSRSDRFSDLLSTEVLDSILGTFGLGRPDIKVVNFARDVEPSEYEWRGLVDPSRVARLFADGATVIFGSLHHRHEPLRRLCAALTRQSGARTQTNIYLTPPHSQGFKPHWDTHDVFVMQVEGSKRWRIYDGGPKIPLPDQKFDPEENKPGDVTSEFTLSAGETLYIPRGVMHAAESGDETSLHITLGLITHSWAQLLGQCVAAATGSSEGWRETLPFGFGRDSAAGFPELKGEFRERLKTLADDVDLESVLLAQLDHVGDVFRPRSGDFLMQATRAGELAPEDTLRARPDIHARLERRGDRVVVMYAQRELDFPGVAERTISRLLSGGACAARDIDDGLDWPGRHAVVSTLIREGLVVRGPVLQA